MDPLTLGRIAEAVGGTLTDPAAADRPVGPDVVIDSRLVTQNALFVAFAGERVDGHDYLAVAATHGAAGALCRRVPPGLSPHARAGCVVVDDPGAALGRLGRAVLGAHPHVVVIGVTGSQGKTSTKDLLAQILAGQGPTIAPQGSFNNEIGVPLTATRVDATTRFLVSEMGARGRGHIDYLCSLTPPRIGVVLNVGQAHLGDFGSRDTIAEAKGELVENLPADGWAVLNAADPRVAGMAGRTRARVARFSADGRPDGPASMRVWATAVTADDFDRHSFTLRMEHADETGQEPVTLRLAGRHHVANAAAAATAAVCAGVPLEAVAAALCAATPVSRWRMEIIDLPDQTVVVNDAYNANPDSTLAACEALARMTVRRRTIRPQVRSWAILGQMCELGDTSEAEHEAIGRAVGSLGIDTLIAVGDDAPAMVAAATAAGCPHALVAADAAAALRLTRPAPGDIVLVKASRAMAMEQVADALVTRRRESTGEFS